MKRTTKRKKRRVNKKLTRSKRKERAKAKAHSQDWRRSSEWHKARKECIELHGCKCWVSGEVLKPHELDVHHVKDASTHPEKRYDQSNLVPIKRDLHKYYHKSLGGFQKTTNKVTLLAFKSLVKTMKFTAKVVGVAKIKALVIIIIGLLYMLGMEMTHDDVEVLVSMNNILDVFK